MIALAAVLAGFGGLLLEMVLVRRHGLLLGNTSSASAMVLAIFLLGLGVGGLLLPRWRFARQRPLGMAAILYGAIALVAVLGDLVLRAVPPLNGGVGLLLALLWPGLPAVLMGGAFPLLFASIERHAKASRAAWLVFWNLAGSVVATFVGGNFLIPNLGMTQSALWACAAYGLTALAVAMSSSGERRPTEAEVAATPPLTAIGRNEFAALAAGFLVLGLELMMLRRLPFFLDGFQPTLSGVLAACLFALTLGSVLGPRLFRSWFGARAAEGSVVVGALVAALGLHESVAPWLGRLGADSNLQFHARILGAAFVAAGPACFCLGATIPLCLTGYVHPETRSRLAGRLFFFQGVGSLLGALVVGHGLPRLLPTTFFVYGVSAVLLIGLAGVAYRFKVVTLTAAVLVLLLGLTGVTGGTVWRHAAAPVAGSRYDQPDRYRYLEHRTDSVVTASVVYDRRAHGMILFTDEFRAAYIDPDTGYMKVLGHLPFLLRDSLRRVAVIALGTGTTANAVHLWPDPKELHVVEISSAVVSLVDHFGKHGPGRAPVPAPFRVDPRTRTHVTDGRRFIARAPAGSLDLISMEPLLPYAPGTVPLYTREFYAYCSEALSEDGLLVQWVPTHSMPESYFRTLLATFGRSFAHHSVWLFDHSTLLIGSKRGHLPTLDALQSRLNAMPEAARRDLHQAGVASADDLIAALVGTDVLAVCKAEDLRDDRPFLEDIGHWDAATRLEFLPKNLAVLREIAGPAGQWPGVREWRGMRTDRLNGLRDLARGRLSLDDTPLALAVMSLARTRTSLPRSALLHGELRQAQRELMEKAILSVAGSRQALERGVKLADLRRHLAKDPGSAILWAARSCLEPKELDQRDAMDAALALDPTIYEQFPALRLAWVEASAIDGYRGPFESLAVLPRGEDLVRRAIGGAAASIAFRSRFRVPIGYACLDVLALRPFTTPEQSTFRALADPALLAYAVQRVEARKGDVAKELLPVWRRDLAIPDGIADLQQGTLAQRTALASALGGRRGPGSLRLLGRLMLDADRGVRRAAGVALFQSVGDKVDYDPESSAARREKSVRALRALGRE